MSDAKANFRPYTLTVFPLGYTGEIGFFEGTREIRIANSMESRRIIRGRTIPVFNLAGLKLADLDQELLATIQLCAVAWTAETGELQQYFERELEEVEAAKVVVQKRKREILHLTVDAGLDLQESDLRQIAELFNSASLQPEGAIVVTTTGIKADIIEINEGAELRLVTAHVQNDFVYQIIDGNAEPQQLVFAGERDDSGDEKEQDDSDDATAV